MPCLYPFLLPFGEAILVRNGYSATLAPGVSSTMLDRGEFICGSRALGDAEGVSGTITVNLSRWVFGPQRTLARQSDTESLPAKVAIQLGAGFIGRVIHAMRRTFSLFQRRATGELPP